MMFRLIARSAPQAASACEKRISSPWIKVSPRKFICFESVLAPALAWSSHVQSRVNFWVFPPRGEIQMNAEKAITEPVLAANKSNAKHSTGPNTELGKSVASRNSTKHGILSKKMLFDSDEERFDYEELRKRWHEYYQPDGPAEEYCVKEMVNNEWNLNSVESLVMKELTRRRRSAEQVDGIFNTDLHLPIESDDLPLDRTWACEKLVVRATADDDVTTSGRERHPKISQGKYVDNTQVASENEKRNRGHLEVHAVLGSSVDTLLRYQVRLKKDLYKAMDKLRELQKERRDSQGKNNNM
jgi:hypothetical protein